MTDRWVTEAVVEQAVLAWWEATGWQVCSGAEIVLGEPSAKRDDLGQVILVQHLGDALARLSLLWLVPESGGRYG